MEKKKEQKLHCINEKIINQRSAHMIKPAWSLN